ncbi:MAG: hypothetical protein ACU85E_02530 [Gammaproteobacteria bacterium]
MNGRINQTRLIGALVLLVFAFLGVGPIPLTSTFGLFVVLFRPKWFKKFVDAVYAGKGR